MLPQPLAGYSQNTGAKATAAHLNPIMGLFPECAVRLKGGSFGSIGGGQTIWERPDNLGPKRLLKLAGVLSRLGGGEAFITGYPAHAFYMHVLRRTFADIIFVHIKRDLVSNAYSLFKASEKGWFSSTPKKCQHLRFDTPHERVVAQLFAIHERILHQSKPQDTLQCSYHEICHAPDETIDRIIDFAQARGIELTRKGPIPSTFDAHLVHAHQNTDTLVLDRCINTYLQQSSYPSFFASLR